MNETSTTNATPHAERGPFRPKFRVYKPNARGTGCAMLMDLHPAHDDTDGSIWVRLANQMTLGDRRARTPVYPHFDWDNAICVKLDFTDLTKMLQVMRGECETIDEGRGLLHTSPRGRTHINLKHTAENGSFYAFEVRRVVPEGDQQDRRAFISFTEAEARGLAAAIESSLGVICFGIPMVIPRNVDAYREATRRMRHGEAQSA